MAVSTQDRSAGQLVREIAEKTQALVRKEVELARVELTADLRAELHTGIGLGAAALLAIWGGALLFMALALGLAAWMPEWLAALVVGGGLLAIAGAVGGWAWYGRVARPLALTRRSLQEDLEWARRRLA